MYYLITIFICLVICYVTYKVVEAANTHVNYEEIFVLKNELDPEWAGSSEKKFNLIGDVSGLMGDKVYVEKRITTRFYKIIKTEFVIQQSNMDDSDYDNF